jgi:flagellar hook-associated protein 3 FlgL
MRIATSQLFSSALNGMQDKWSQIGRLQQQLSRGERILTPSDDPAATARIMELSEALASTEQYQANGDMANHRLTLEETTLAGASDILQRVRELVVQGGNGTLSAQDRGFIAKEAREQLDALVQLANTQDSNGEYLFAGFQRYTSPFSRNAAGTVNFNGDLGQRSLQIGPNRQVADGDSGQDVFMAIRNGNGTFAVASQGSNTGTGVITPGSVTDFSAYVAHDFQIVFTAADTYDVIDSSTSPSTTVLTGQNYVKGATIAFNGMETSISGDPASGDVFTVTPSANQSVFETVSNVISALESSASTPAAMAQFNTNMGRALADIDQSIEKILGTRASVGTRLKAVDAQKSANEDAAMDLESVRSTLQDLDYVEAITRLNAEMTALQAAQKSFAQTQSLSLFNYL